jgi:hypothetical protein
MPSEAIQGRLTSNWNSGAPPRASKPNHSPSETAKVPSEIRSAMTLACRLSSAGKKRSASAPASGMKITAVSRVDIAYFPPVPSTVQRITAAPIRMTAA